MNQRRAKLLKRKAKEMAAVWLKTLLPPEQAELVNARSVEEFEATQDKHVHANGRCVVSAYSTRHFYKRLKRAYKNKEFPDFQLKSAEELG